MSEKNVFTAPGNPKKPNIDIIRLIIDLIGLISGILTIIDHLKK